MENQNMELHRVCSTAIIHKDGKYIIIKRSPDKDVFPNRWHVPGGGLEKTDYINTPKTTPDAWYYAVENSLKREIVKEPLALFHPALRLGKVRSWLGSRKIKLSA